MSVSGLRFKSLVKKMSFLTSDLEYHREEHGIRKGVFQEAFIEFMENSTTHEYSEEKLISNLVDVYEPKKHHAEPEDKEIDKTDESSMLTQNIKMYKSIAKKTHPDLHKDSEKTKMFVKASNAVKSDDWYTLFDLCENLGIEQPEPNKEHIVWLNNEIKTTQGIIERVKGTFEWKYSEPSADKARVMTTYCDITCKKK